MWQNVKIASGKLVKCMGTVLVTVTVSASAEANVAANAFAIGRCIEEGII